MLRRIGMVALSVMLVFAALPSVASDINERVKPWDEGPQDPSFLKFRNELKDIIARKDAASLFKLLAPDIKVDFGGVYGGPRSTKNGSRSTRTARCGRHFRWSSTKAAISTVA
jgi:hypothetical protein